ncbi:hypothetical protein MTR_3g027630 [Medicago truncatula]|uniref:Uncharacterized protein n=1 Tax=Medicago truncatula TaxID=3880 RepID=G7IWI0_MEDTR|nr:hypothetical protein MTR_3g027630 [Medicago truncatula]
MPKINPYGFDFQGPPPREARIITNSMHLINIVEGRYTNPHVQNVDDDGGDEDEGRAHLHDDPVHHNHEADGQYDND